MDAPICSWWLLIVSTGFIVVASVTLSTPSTVAGCAAEYTDASGCTDCVTCKKCILWPETEAQECSFSTPYCLDQNYEPVARCCTANDQYTQWEPAYNCNSFQQPLPKCPAGFTYNDQVKICYMTESGTYPLDCPYEEAVPFETYRTILDTELVEQTPFWMTVRRTEPLGFLVWYEASTRYMDLFQEAYYLPDKIFGEDCLLYYNSSYIVSSKCSDTHLGICAYPALTTVKNNLCKFGQDDDFCRQSDFSTRSKCFCVSYAKQPETKLVEFLEPYQNLIYPSLTTNPCMIGLFRTGSTYNWSSGAALSYAYWSIGVNFQADFIYGSIDNNGWGMNKEPYSIQCYLYEKDMLKHEPKLNLLYDEQKSLFVLTIEDADGLKHVDDKPLVFCFTDATSYELVYKYTLKQEGEAYTFAPHAKGPGNYWCEAFEYPDLDIIKSSVLFYRDPKSGSEFVTILRFTYVPHTNVLSQSMFEFYERVLFIKITSDHLESRIMKILALDEELNQVTLKVHLSSKIKRDDIEVEFNDIKGTVIAAIDELSLQVVMESFLSSDYCLGETTNGITWQTTPVGSVGISNKFCFSSGEIIQRKCEGNFMDGAKWEDIPPCDDVTQKSEVTNRLLDVLESNLSMPETIKRTRELSQRFAEYVPLDVFLLSGILEKTSNYSKVNLMDLVDIVDNLHRIQNEVLDQSQFGMKATDRILHFIDQILLKSSVVGCDHLPEATTPSEVISNNFDSRKATNQIRTKTKISDTKQDNVSIEGYSAEDIEENRAKFESPKNEDDPSFSEAVSNRYKVISEESKLIENDFDDLLGNPEPTKDSAEDTISIIAINPCIERALPHIQIHSENFILTMTNIKNTNITGLVLKGSETKYLYVDQNIFDLDLDLAVVFNPDLRSEIIANGGKVIIAIYTKDALFNENSSKTVSKIISVLFPGMTTLTSPVTTVFNNISAAHKSCSFWSYANNASGTWFPESASAKNNSLEACDFWHTTHFALLLTGSTTTSSLDSVILEIITNISCGLSLFGLVGILLTAILFRRWRRNTGNQILINFSAAIFIEIAAFYSSNAIKSYVSSEVLCTIIGIVLHYSLISQFCWMFIIAMLQFRRFVEVLGGPPKYVLLKACLCGWILPLLPVLCVYFLDQKNYVSGHVGLCYPSGLGLYLGVWLPIAIIVAINFVIFLYIIYNVVHRKTECTDTVNNDLLFQWRLGILLFFMLGLSWSFGLLTELNFGIVFVYLFCITAPGQGFVMFLFFIVFNRSTRFMYVHSVKSYFTDSLSY